MKLGSNVRFEGDRGKHSNDKSEPCDGRDFKVVMVGVGAAYTNEVQCLKCGRKLTAYEERLAA
jgi:hypothetical protein